jgi:hypothetical protein
MVHCNVVHDVVHADAMDLPRILRDEVHDVDALDLLGIAHHLGLDALNLLDELGQLVAQYHPSEGCALDPCVCDEEVSPKPSLFDSADEVHDLPLQHLRSRIRQRRVGTLCRCLIPQHGQLEDDALASDELLDVFFQEELFRRRLPRRRTKRSA